jgi:hypothetical protein
MKGPQPVKTLTSPILVLAALAALLVGCGGGGGGGSSSGGGNGGSSGGGGVNARSVGDCLNSDENFIVQPSETTLDGSSPAGVNFTLTFYKDNAAAKAAAAKKNKKFTAVVENGVVDFRGNPSAFTGAPPAKISPVELASIKRCIDKTKG